MEVILVLDLFFRWNVISCYSLTERNWNYDLLPPFYRKLLVFIQEYTQTQGLSMIDITRFW